MAAFPPIVGNKPRVLILGSMPGQMSLQQKQYYAHPRNAFWWLMSHHFGFLESLDYSERVAELKSSGVAVWDVLHDCERKGSLDSNIVKQSETVNNFASFFDAHPMIEKILFNGVTAETIFKRHWGSLMDTPPQRSWLRMPSTSPAHASLTREQKYRIWQQALGS